MHLANTALIFLFLLSARATDNPTMRSAGCDQIGNTPQLPNLTPHPNTPPDPERTWHDPGDVKPPRSLLGLPELGWPDIFQSCGQMMEAENEPCLQKAAPHGLCPADPLEEVVQSSSSSSSPSLLDGHAEECSLEQVQTMVVGEVLKDIDTACKLLNIEAGEEGWRGGQWACV